MLALTLALLVPITHGTTHATLPPTLSSEAPTAEYDLIENTSRPPTRHTPRPATATRPSPVASRRHPPATHHGRAFPAPPRLQRPYAPYALHALRSVVLRC
ncbi:hypothetical protein [Streptomyces sp. DSM 40750]|uniref:hypothetical protein n=1 Tax=Streptomyces sp. DSM 40750 TaxID=2801030 RepID=UPI00214B1950|nr:hypothetical protein [Streptomyces sp. DSM 40750]UUU23342.1 hypothetical protein JIX55_25415 [Streptomyces sp. DSM 40750]